MKDLVEWLKENVTLVVVLVIISAIVAIFMLGQGFFASSMKTAGSTQAKASNSQYNGYDGTSISGAEVISAIKANASTAFVVKVKAKAGTVISYTTPSAYPSALALVPTGVDYIEASAIFNAVLDKSSNGAIVGVTFTQP